MPLSDDDDDDNDTTTLEEDLENDVSFCLWFFRYCMVDDVKKNAGLPVPR